VTPSGKIRTSGGSVSIVHMLMTTLSVMVGNLNGHILSDQTSRLFTNGLLMKFVLKRIS
jgi:hypothetical protein